MTKHAPLTTALAVPHPLALSPGAIWLRQVDRTAEEIRAGIYRPEAVAFDANDGQDGIICARALALVPEHVGERLAAAADLGLTPLDAAPLCRPTEPAEEVAAAALYQVACRVLTALLELEP